MILWFFDLSKNPAGQELMLLKNGHYQVKELEKSKCMKIPQNSHIVKAIMSSNLKQIQWFKKLPGPIFQALSPGNDHFLVASIPVQLDFRSDQKTTISWELLYMETVQVHRNPALDLSFISTTCCHLSGSIFPCKWPKSWCCSFFCRNCTLTFLILPCAQ